MRARKWLVRGTLLGGVLLLLCVTDLVHSQQKAPVETMTQRLARRTKLTEDKVILLLQELAPAIQAELVQGKQVTLPGLGTFRIVRVAGHKDLQVGRPVVVTPVNTVEFLPVAGLATAANAPGVQPEEYVPAFQYNPLPGQTPGQKVGQIRVPPIRVR
jgi:nucleoid DNA-binding protein